MEQERKIRVAITQGDTNGVGYEVILKAFADPAILELCTPIIYGSPKIATYHRKALNLETNFSIINSAEDAREGRVNLLSCFDDEVKIELGQPSKEAGEAALKALDRAMTDFRQGYYDVLVTAPINKATIQSTSFHFPGHDTWPARRRSGRTCRCQRNRQQDMVQRPECPSLPVLQWPEQ